MAGEATQRIAWRDHRNQEGMATLFAVVALILVSAVILIMVENSTRSSRNSLETKNQIEGVEASDSATRSLQAAMALGAIDSDIDEYTLSAIDLASVVQTEGGRILNPPTASAYQDIDQAAYPIVEVPGASTLSPSKLWQVVAIIPPAVSGFPNANLIFYVRSWKQITSGDAAARNASATRPQYRRVEMRQGSLADYQILSDMSIQLDNNIQINGRIHTNGFSDRIQRPPSGSESARIWQRPTSGPAPDIQCTTPVDGVTPSLSTGSGSIVVNAPDCKKSPNSDKFVDLAKAASSLKKLGDPCTGTSTTYVVYHCAQYPRYKHPDTDQWTYDVDLSSMYATGKVTHVYDGDVRVRGAAPKGRVTIATQQSASGGIVGAAASATPPDIFIVGDIRHGPRSTTFPASNVGLISAGNIIIEPDGCAGDTRTIEAAMIAMSGGINIGPRYSTQIRPDTTLPAPCQNLAVKGSITSHLPMALIWRWPSASGNPANEAVAGFLSRDVKWDESLGLYPPPFYPLGDPWEIVDIRVANKDCAATGAWAATC